MTRPARAWAGLLLALGWLLLLSGCAPLQTQHPAQAQTRWQGRLAVKVATEPPQAFSANFALQGSAAQGALSLTSVLGTRLADMRWGADAATLQTPKESLRFDSVDAMILHSVGTPLPLNALFGWLQGRAGAAAGWDVDLQDLPSGRIRAWRLAPDAAAEIKIILDPG
ncbi:MAG: lipoprotein insertase outer membrane protein LolB [Rhodoferax sp.]|nr:lipoprotein insertase outer membrane protein LolB [Rhodoferax sp.]